MTNMISEGQIMKTDRIGRLKTPTARREELLDEFERSGLSGPKFASTIGIKYQTFASWVTRRRKQEPTSVRDKSKSLGWVEAVVDQASVRNTSTTLVIDLPGGARMTVADELQAVLAAHLLRSLPTPLARC
jgi:hypothetical protein